MKKLIATCVGLVLAFPVFSQTFTVNNLIVQGTSTIPYTGIGGTATTVAAKLQQTVDIKDYGATCNGVAIDNTAIANFNAAWGSTPVTLRINCPLKINAGVTFAPTTELAFDENGSLTGSSGVEVINVQAPIRATRHTIFSNDVPVATIGMNVFPEWFGASTTASDNSGAFNLALDFLKNVGGEVQIAPGTFLFTAGITHFHSYESLIGSGPQATTLQFNGTNTTGIQVVGVAGTPLSNVTLRNFNMISNTPGTSNTGLTLQYTALARVSDMQITNFFQSVYMQRATNSFFYRMGGAYTAATNGAICWVIDGGGTGAGGNASSTWRDTYCQGSASGPSGPTGQIAYKAFGAYVSDMYFSNASSAETNYGYYLDYSSATAGGYADVIIQNPVVDGFTAQGIFVNAVPTGQMVTILGGWIDPVSMLAETDSVYITGSTGSVIVNGTQFSGQANYAYDVGVRVIGSMGVRVTNSTFNDHKFAIEESGSSYNVYSGNSFYNTPGHAGTQQIALLSSGQTMVTGNSFNGYSTNAVAADGASSKVGVVANTLNSATLSAPRISNSSVGAIGGSDGSTGLNSGY